VEYGTPGRQELAFVAALKTKPLKTKPRFYDGVGIPSKAEIDKGTLSRARKLELLGPFALQFASHYTYQEQLLREFVSLLAQK
jgi:hypothetical protein